MSPDIPKRSSAASPWASSWIVAAVALILNWTAPAHLQFPFVFELSDAAPGVSSDLRAPKPGTLPRAKPRSLAYEADREKAPQSKLGPTGKSYALPPRTSLVVTTSFAPIAPHVADATPPAIATRVFDPRAPPALTA
jgi:hypothetical protein